MMGYNLGMSRESGSGPSDGSGGRWADEQAWPQKDVGEGCCHTCVYGKDAGEGCQN